MSVFNHRSSVSGAGRGGGGDDSGMFSKLTNKITGAFDGMFRKKTITKSDVDMAMYKVRIALLEADVANAVVKEFIKQVSEDCVGSKIDNLEEGTSKADYVHARVLERMRLLLGKDRSPFLPDLLGEDERATMMINRSSAATSDDDVGTDAATSGTAEVDDNKAQQDDKANVPLQKVLVAGIQGSGKTTTSAKLAFRLRNVHGKKVLAVSLDVRRPAAQEQLEIMCGKAGVDCIARDESANDPVEIARAAIDRATREGYDVLILDSAGRLHVDKQLMEEMNNVNEAVQPTETLLVADAMTGQDAVRIASQFHNSLGVSGICLTRMDGDARGGAAISMRAVTGIPIKFIGVGEDLKDLDRFDPKSMASRILGASDFVGVAERILESTKQSDVSRVKSAAARMLSGHFTFNEYLVQLEQMDKLGSGWMSSLPSMLGMGNQMKTAMDKFNFKEMIPLHTKIINKMSEEEKKNPMLLRSSSARRHKLANAAGVVVREVNQMLKMHEKLQGMSGTMASSPMGDKLKEMINTKDKGEAMEALEMMKNMMGDIMDKKGRK